jgi:hypothetical protein
MLCFSIVQQWRVLHGESVGGALAALWWSHPVTHVVNCCSVLGVQELGHVQDQLGSSTQLLQSATAARPLTGQQQLNLQLTQVTRHCCMHTCTALKNSLSYMQQRT